MKTLMKCFLLIGTVLLILWEQLALAQGTDGSWKTVSSSGLDARTGLAAVATVGKLYVLGGSNHGAYPTTIKEYDPSAATWSKVTALGSFSPRFEFAACSVDGKIYAIGGVNYSSGTGVLIRSVDVFDPQTSAWSPLVTTGEFESRWGFCAAAIGQKIYIIGGDTAPNLSGFHPPTNYVQVLDLVSNTWSNVSCIGSWSRRAGATASMIDGKIYVVGGDTSVVYPLPVDVFDPATNSWSQPATTGTFLARGGHAAGVLDGKIYVAGGWSGISDRADVQIFDPGTNAWSDPSISGHFTARYGASSCVIAGKLYVIGGTNDANNPLAVTEVLTPSGSNEVLALGLDSAVGVFPNPAQSMIRVNSTNRRPGLVDDLGRNYECPLNGNTFDISQLPPGVYYLSDGGSTNGAPHRARFVKE